VSFLPTPNQFGRCWKAVTGASLRRGGCICRGGNVLKPRTTALSISKSALRVGVQHLDIGTQGCHSA
jgi:hypothetical protein